MKKVCVIGHFAFGKELLNGQTVKTKIITKELEKQLGKNEVLKIDTHGGKKTMIKLIFRVVAVMKNCRNVVMLPAHNGVRFFAPLLCFWKNIFNTKIHYIVIGGWLSEFIKDKKLLQKSLKKFDGIYVETNTMKKSLEQQGFKNIFVMPNCKELHILRENELIYSFTKPLKLCTFSRVMREKGIEDAIRAVTDVNKRIGDNVFSLDIYGQIDEGYRDEFDKLKEKFPQYIRYCGCIVYDQSTETLKNYYALMFPTRFFTEGIPGTIIDAYASGLPVIASKWESFYDLIEDGEVGYGYQFKNYNELVNTLLKIAVDPKCFIQMKTSCIDKAKNFTSSKIVSDFIAGWVVK